MTPGDNGASTPEDDDPFGYLYADGQANGAQPPSGGGYGYPNSVSRRVTTEVARTPLPRRRPDDRSVAYDASRSRPEASCSDRDLVRSPRHGPTTTAADLRPPGGAR